ncbi:MAG: formate dehydrogenase subunit delta [Hyphomicrobium sp.]
MSNKNSSRSAEELKSVLPLDRLVIMANQIGDFFAPYPPQRRAEGIRNHLRTYWDPRMRQNLLEYIDNGGLGLQPHVVEGAMLLTRQEDPKGYYGPPKA